MADRSIVIFLFAQEKLLFRYPLHNPFTIDINNGNAKSQGKSSAACTDTNNTAAINAASAKREGSHQQQQRQHQQQQQQQQFSSSVAPAGVGVRHKPRTTRRSQHITPSTTTITVMEADSDDMTRAAPLMLSANSTVMDRSLSPEDRKRGNNGGSNKNSTSNKGNMNGNGNNEIREDVADTCVGVQTTVLVHLLRARFSTCTTIQFAGGTFLIYPLFPCNVKSSRPSSLGVQRSHSATADDAFMDEENGGNNITDGEYGREDGKKRKINTNVPSTSPSQGVVLVVAMNQPDREDCAISNLVQVFMNVLVREELRSHYVTNQVLAMEQRIHAWEMCGDNDGSDGGPGKHDAMTLPHPPPHPLLLSPSGRGASKRMSVSEMHAGLLKDSKLSLCTEISLLVQQIMSFHHGGGGSNTDYSSLGTSSPQLQRGGIGNSKPRSSNGNASSADTAMPSRGGVTDLIMCGLFSLPASSILDHNRPRRPYQTSTYVKQNANYIVTLEDPSFVENLGKSYVEAVGLHASQLLPLATIHAALGTLSTPWRIGGLYRALERCLSADHQQRQGIKKKQQQQQQMSASTTITPHGVGGVNTINNNNNNEGVSRLRWLRTEESFAFEAGNSFSLEEQNFRLDKDGLIVEAVEFLRLNGALAVDTGITLVFTHGTLLPEAAATEGDRTKGTVTSGPLYLNMTAGAQQTNNNAAREKLLVKPKPPSCIPVAPASMVGILLFEGMRMSTNFTLGAGGGSGGGSGWATPFFAAEDQPEMLTPMMTSTTTVSLPATSLVNAGGGDIPHYEVYCAWGNACPICEELASAPHAWRVGMAPVRLSFPFLAAAIVDAAARRGAQGAARPIDSECCRLLADQRPWFTLPNTFTAPATGDMPGRSAVQTYRCLTRGCSDGVVGGRRKTRDKARGEERQPAQMQTQASSSSLNWAESGGQTKRNIPNANQKITAMTSGCIPDAAREWLAESCSVIESRLAEALRQRKTMEENAQKQVEQRYAAATTSTTIMEVVAGSNNSNSNHQPQQQKQQQQQHAPLASQRYRKRTVFSPTYVPGVTGEILPLAPMSLSNSHISSYSSPLHPVYGVDYNGAVQTPRLAGAERIAPFEVLMQFVFHHTVALLWGKPGIDVETLLQLLECNLRRLRPFLTNYTYAQQLARGKYLNHRPTVSTPNDMGSCSTREGSCSMSAESMRDSCDTIEGHSSTPHPRSPIQEGERKRTSKGKNQMKAGKEEEDGEEEEGEEVLSSFDQQLLESYKVFTDLSLLGALKQLIGITVEVVPTRLLLHAVVNAFADVLFIGRSSSATHGSGANE